MKSTVLADLERDRDFKRIVFPNSFVYKNFLIVAPVFLLFIGLAGIVFLLKQNMLISYYTIFYLVCFVLGTIWLKAIRKLIVSKEISKPGTFLTCWGSQLKEEKDKIYFIFTTGTRRHDKIYIEHEKENRSGDILKIKNGQAYFLSDMGAERELYITAISKTLIKKRNPNWKASLGLPLIFINRKHVSPIAGRYLN